jgi:hypothetical protein
VPGRKERCENGHGELYQFIFCFYNRKSLWLIYNKQKCIWLTFLEGGNSTVQGPHLVRTFLLSCHGGN